MKGYPYNIVIFCYEQSTKCFIIIYLCVYNPMWTAG
jgi:hypothetical protein